MLAILAEAALRSFMLGGVVWLALKGLRVRNPHVEMTCSVVVLAASLAMPLLMQFTHLTIIVPSPPAAVQERLPSSLGPFTEALRDAPLDAHAPGAAQNESHQPIDWRALALALYAGVAAVLLLRLALGLLLTLRLARAARPIRADWAEGSDIRVSDDIGGPVTFGSVILLPPDCPDWDLQKRQAVLAHERAHIASRDFYLLLLASLNRAMFWFTPFAWWQLRRLAELAEIIADARAIEVLEDRLSYAELLLELVQNVRTGPVALEMAHGCTVPARVDRILASVSLPARIGWRERLKITAAIVPIALLASGMIAYRTEHPPVLTMGPPGFVPPAVHKPDQADFYALDARLVFAIFQEGDDLFGQLTGQRKLGLTLAADGTYSYPAASGPISFARDADRSSDLALRQNGRAITAHRIAGMRRAEMAANAAVLDQYVGWYRLSASRVVGITRDGASLALQETGRARFWVTADSADSFSGEHDDFIMFLRDRQGQFGQVLLSDPIAGAHLAQRIDAAQAKAIEGEFTRRTAEASERFKDQAPAPGGKEAILRGIADLQRGTPNYAGMSEQLAEKIRPQQGQLHAILTSLGAVEQVFFRGVGPGGYDIYGVKFANGSAEFRLLLGPDGRADDAIFRPNGNEAPGGIVGCGNEAGLKSPDGGAPIRIAIYNESGDAIRLYNLDAGGKRVAHGAVGDNATWTILTSVDSPWVVTDRDGQCLEIVLPGQHTRYLTVEAARAGGAGEYASPRSTPLAGGEEKLRQYILGLSSGRPDYDRMTAEVATQTRQQLPLDQAILARLGALRAMSFRGVTPMGSDVYMASFANGTAEWRIALAKDGSIARIALGPQY